MSEWQPIETAPKDEEIMVYSPRAGILIAVTYGNGVWLSSLDIGGSCTDVLWGENGTGPTQWMVLPDPPDDGE